MKSWETWNTSDNARYNKKKENEVQSPKSAKRRGQVVVNKHPENQTSFGKQNTSPGHKTYREAAKSSEATQPYNEKENLLIFSDRIPGKRKMHELNRVIKNGKVKHLFFSRCNFGTSITVFRCKLANVWS